MQNRLFIYVAKMKTQQLFQIFIPFYSGKTELYTCIQDQSNYLQLTYKTNEKLPHKYMISCLQHITNEW